LQCARFFAGKDGKIIFPVLLFLKDLKRSKVMPQAEQIMHLVENYNALQDALEHSRKLCTEPPAMDIICMFIEESMVIEGDDFNIASSLCNLKQAIKQIEEELEERELI
jgi:hypothetical protein